MPESSRARNLTLLLALQGVLFVVSLPGVGIGTRKFTQYATWAAPIFLGLTLLIFAGVIAGVLLARRSVRQAAYLAIVVAVAAVAITLFDLSAVAGPPDPPGPLVLSAIVLVVSALLILLAAKVLRAATSATVASTP